MLKTALCAAALVAATVTVSTPSANAASVTGLATAIEKSDGVTHIRRGGGGGGRIGVYRGGNHFRGAYHRGFRPHFGFYAAAPLVYGYSYYNSGGGHCAWLHRKARHTGSSYWWHRYRNEC